MNKKVLDLPEEKVFMYEKEQKENQVYITWQDDFNSKKKLSSKIVTLIVLYSK